MRLLLAVLILLLFLLLLSLNHSRFIHAWLQGAWEGDRAFCEEAGIGGMLLFVGPFVSDAEHRGWRSFLIMFSDETILHSQILYLQFGGVAPLPSFLGRLSPLSTSLSIQPAELYVEDTLPVEDLMPLELSALLDPAASLMEWRDSENSYARFFKNAAHA